MILNSKTPRTPWLLAALAVGGLGGAVLADTPPLDAPPPPAWHHGERPGLMLAGGLLHALRQLNLTAAQQQSVQSILATARQQLRAERGTEAADFSVLSNPGDPNYASALKAAQDRAVARIQAASQVEQQIYAVLTADQQAQLPTVLASMAANRRQHHWGPPAAPLAPPAPPAAG